MNNIQKRFILFLFGCIGTRLLFVYIAKNVSLQVLPYLGYLALIPVLGWLYILFIKSRDTGLEVFGGKIWWNSIRPIHIALYSTFAYLAINKNKNSWIALLVDVGFGLGAFLHHHYISGNFNRLL